MIRRTRLYDEFREKLKNDQLWDLRAEIQNRLVQGLLPNRVLTVIELGAAVVFHIYVDQDDDHDNTWLLGGHWVRFGEPSAAFLRQMQQWAQDIAEGKEPK